jgi:N-acetylglutamate synthase-like GNAT family acetyltransferase
MLIELVGIHPAYWCRGHGKTLLNWGLALAEKDGVNTGVIANTAAVGLYLALGFVRIGKITLEDEEEPPNKVDGILLTYDTPEAA